MNSTIFTIDNLTLLITKQKQINGLVIKFGKNEKLKELGFTKKYNDAIIKKMKYHDTFDVYETFVNPYAFITLPKGLIYKILKMTQIEVYGISKIKPLSRAYFKLWELIYHFDLVPLLDRPLISGHIAEGPGGFINALVDYRKKYAKNASGNKATGITLVDTISALKFQSPQTQEFMKRHHSIITISQGANGTGDINKIDNILEFKSHFTSGLADFVTCDGGIDTDKQKDIQEQLSAQLLFNQIVTTLSIQKKGGNAVIKCYSIMTMLTCQCIYLLASHYQKVYVTKPVTSKITNDEHYIVCCDFVGIQELELKSLYEITKQWKNGEVNGIYSAEVPSSFIKSIKAYNVKTTKLFMSYLDKVFKMIKKPSGLQLMADKNKKIATEWCRQYDVL